jgi:hypothetical protein
MEGKKASVFGLYKNASLAERALDQLTSAQFASDDVSVLMRTAPGAMGSGGTLGLLAGFAALTIPDAEPLIGAGPIRGPLTGRNTSSSAPGGSGLEAALGGLGFSEHEARNYATKIREGHALLAVRCVTSDEVSRASGVFKSIGAEAIALVREAGVSADLIRAESAKVTSTGNN